MAGPILWLDGQLPGWLTGVRGKAVAARTLVHRAANEIAVPLRAVQVDPHLGFLCHPVDHFLPSESRQRTVFGLQDSQCGGLVHQASGDGRLKTQARVRVGT